MPVFTPHPQDKLTAMVNSREALIEVYHTRPEFHAIIWEQPKLKAECEALFQGATRGKEIMQELRRVCGQYTSINCYEKNKDDLEVAHNNFPFELRADMELPKKLHEYFRELVELHPFILEDLSFGTEFLRKPLAETQTHNWMILPHNPHTKYYDGERTNRMHADGGPTIYRQIAGAGLEISAFDARGFDKMWKLRDEKNAEEFIPKGTKKIRLKAASLYVFKGIHCGVFPEAPNPAMHQRNEQAIYKKGRLAYTIY